jgi:methionyl-tRNA formyltransferase
MSKLRVVFMGTPDFAVPTLSEVVCAGHDIAAVYTQPPRRAGRGMSARLSPVHKFADDAGIPVYTPASFRNRQALDELGALKPDVCVVVAYGLILPRTVLDIPAEGCLNLHASLLPRWRGAAPIQRAIMAGDPETGVSVMRMDEGMDAGPVCMIERVPIGADMTAGELHDELSFIGATLMGRALDKLSRGQLECAPQPKEGVTYAPKISKEEARINWEQSAQEVHNRIRAMSPYPGAWFEALLGGRPERVKVLRSVCVKGRGEPGQLLDNQLTVACGTQAVRLTRVQRSGKRPVSGVEFLRGFPLGKGTHFG